MIHVMIAYDIYQDNKRRQVMHKLLEKYGERVQYSVFECNLYEAEYKKLQDEVLHVIDRQQDSVKYYPVCKACDNNATFIGNGRTFEEERFFII